MSVTFYTGPMSSGKSTLLLQDAYNLRKRTFRVAIGTGSETGIIRSRFSGHEVEGIKLSTSSSYNNMDYLLIDEAQFLSPQLISGIVADADRKMLHVRAYGLTSDFQGNMFPGTAKWMALSDSVQWLQASIPCWCGRPATMNSRVVQGHVTHEGEQVMEGDISEDSMYYVPLCRQHWRSKQLEPTNVL